MMLQILYTCRSLIPPVSVGQVRVAIVKESVGAWGPEVGYIRPVHTCLLSQDAGQVRLLISVHINKY